MALPNFFCKLPEGRVQFCKEFWELLPSCNALDGRDAFLFVS